MLQSWTIRVKVELLELLVAVRLKKLKIDKKRCWKLQKYFENVLLKKKIEVYDLKILFLKCS